MIQLYPDTTSYDNIDRDTKNTLESQLGVVGGTMGLLTGEISWEGFMNLKGLFRLLHFERCRDFVLHRQVYLFSEENQD